MAKYPRSVRIGESRYRIRVTDTIDKSKSDTLGICRPYRKEICLLRHQSGDEMMKTYIHEVLHAFEEEYDIRISHKAVRQLEEAMFDFWVANMQGEVV